MNDALAKLLKNPNAGHLVLLLVIAGGGGANYSRVDDVARDLAAIRAEQLEQRSDLRDQDRRLAAIERAR